MKFFNTSLKNQIAIIITIIACLLASMLFLSYTEVSQREKSEDFWSIYFVDPLDHALGDFVIDNHSQNTEFTYTITVDDQTLASEVINVSPGTQARIKVKDEHDLPRASITVRSGDQKKSIYKN